jgi:hypothetical protein
MKKTNKTRVQGVSINLDELKGVKNKEELKKMALFPDDSGYDELWTKMGKAEKADK